MMKTKQGAPQLVFHTGKQQNQLTFTNICNLNKKPLTKRFREISNKQCLASMHGWFVMEDKSSSKNVLLWNPSTRETINLPPRNSNDLDDLFFSKCILLAPPTDLDCMVMFWSLRNSFLLYWNLGDTTWTKQPCDLGDDHDFIVAVTVSSVDRCMYAFTSGALLAIIDRDPCGVLAVRMLTTKRPQRYFETYGCHRFLVEFGGDIYVAYLHFVGWGAKQIHGVEVFKMVFSKKNWVKMNSLGDLALCLSNTNYVFNSVLFSPTDQSGIKRNHVYIILDSDRSLYVHSVEDDSLSLYSLRLPTPFFGAFWSFEFYKNYQDGGTKEDSYIDLIGEVNKEKEILSMSIEEIGQQKADSIIKLDKDVLYSIAMRLPLPTDCINFRLVSKSFSESLPKIRWTAHPSGATIQYPWLMFSKRENSRCNFLDPICNVTHCLNMPKLLGVTVWFSMAGWLVMSKRVCSKRICSMFLLNPFTEVTIALPKLKLKRFDRFHCVSLSAPPASSRDCIVFCITVWTIFFVRIGEHAWTSKDREPAEFMSISNPVFHNGAFYCLGREDNMGVFHIKDDNTSDWIIHPLPSPHSSVHQNYLVKSNGNLLSVFVGRNGSWVRVYRLQIMHKSGNIKMSWESLDSLGDQVVFVSRSTSLSLKAISKEMENKVYFPLLFHNKMNNNMFYSLESCKWHSALGDCCNEDIYNSSDQLHCTWIQPTLRCNHDCSR